MDLVLTVEAEADVSDDLRDSLTHATGSLVHVARKSHLDGSVDTVIQVVQVALLAASSVPAALIPFLDRNRVRKIKCGDVEIENPTPEQARELWELCIRRLEGA